MTDDAKLLAAAVQAGDEGAAYALADEIQATVNPDAVNRLRLLDETALAVLPLIKEMGDINVYTIVPGLEKWSVGRNYASISKFGKCGYQAYSIADEILKGRAIYLAERKNGEKT